MKEGITMHVYSCNASMGNTVFYNSDGDYLIGERVMGKLAPVSVCFL